MVQVWMLSDNWLSRDRLLENFNKVRHERNGTGTCTTGVTTIAILHFVQAS